MPAWLLPVVVKLLETQLVPFLEWCISGSVRLIERHYARKGVPVPERTAQRPVVAAVTSKPFELPPDAQL
jgi:hypothetical protein